MNGIFRMEVTADDLARLDPDAFDAVWTVLGLLFRERTATSVSLEPQANDLQIMAPESLAEQANDSTGSNIPGTIPEPVPEVLDPPPPPDHIVMSKDDFEVVEKIARASRPTRPLGETTVTCDPGCGLTIPQAVIGAHRRTCEAVLAFKAERGVTVVPDLLGSAAPLPEAPASDFQARREAAAKDAVERTWRRNHEAEPDPVHETSDAARPLTARQIEVVDAIREHGGMSAAARAKDWSYKAIESSVRNLRQAGRLPADVQTILEANVAHPKRLTPIEPTKGQVRTPEQRERMRQAQLDSWKRRRGAVAS